MNENEGIEAIFLYATEGILIVNETGEIIKANSSAAKLFGYELNELEGNKIESLVPTRYAHKHSGYRAKYTQQPHARSMGAGIDLYGLKKNGTEFPVEISLSPYTSMLGSFVIAFIVDISERKLAEEKLKNYSAELEKQVKNRTIILEEAIEELEKTKKSLHQALEKEKELNELKSRFVSMASHEFRTPLATMLSSLSLVNKYADLNDSENRVRHVSKIKTSISNLTEILNDFLSVTKLEEGKVNINAEEFDLNLFIADVLAEMKFIASDGQVLKQHHIGNNWVRMDKKILKNILLNLISNAIKFTPDGGVIEVKSQVETDFVRIAVKDCGIGISENDQKHLFERFFRGQNATHIQGTGLGLSIVAKYAELMKARIDFESKELKGTTFTITIPR